MLLCAFGLLQLAFFNGSEMAVHSDFLASHVVIVNSCSFTEPQNPTTHQKTNQRRKLACSTSRLFDGFVFPVEVWNSKEPTSSQVMLTVRKETVLAVNVTVGAGYDHTVSGRLLCDGQPVSSKLVRLKINETEFNLTTSANGFFSLVRDLQPKNNQSTLYMITASFEGDLPLNATVWANALDGTSYAACTTIQFGRGLWPKCLLS